MPRRKPTYTHPLVLQLRAERNRQGWSQAAVAERAGYHYSTLAAWELGRDAPTLFALECFANALGFELILRRKDNETTNSTS